MKGFEVFRCIMHPDTPRDEFHGSMIRIFHEKHPQKIHDILALLDEHHIQDYDWVACVVGWDRKDPICILTIVIPDDKQAVMFRLWTEYPLQDCSKFSICDVAPLKSKDFKFREI
jgi:hypothetical protein